MSLTRVGLHRAGEESPEALVVLADRVTLGNRRRIIELTKKTRVPLLYEFRVFAESGGLLSYGPSLAYMLPRAANYVGKILRGAKLGDLSVERFTRFELVISTQTAKSPGSTIPPSVLVRAGKMIQ